MINQLLCFFLIIFGLSFTAYAEVNNTADDAFKEQQAIPSEVTEKYEKKKTGVFEAQGFGEDFAKEEESKELQLQRRVDIYYEGKVRFKNGATVWATEDPGAQSPKLNIRTSEQVGIKQEDVKFNVYTNYSKYIKRWELRIFKLSDLNTQNSIETLSGGVQDLTIIDYKIPKDKFNVGDQIFYQLKVFDEEDHFDVTQPQRLVFVERDTNQNLQQQNKQVQRDLLHEIWGQDITAQRNILVRGSRIRIVGQGFPITYTVSYLNQPVQISQTGSFLIEEHVPVGEHKMNLKIKDSEDKSEFIVPLDVKVDGKYLFFVGIADFKVGQNKLSDQVSTVTDPNEYGDVFLDGRMAFYLKGKIQGKYLITAQADTTEGPVKNMFDGVFRKNSESLFRRLDPDRYYPVYGDSSTTTQSAPTSGKLFVRVDLDRSYLMWGNDNTDFTRTLLSQYNRTLYGAHLKYQSNTQIKFGAPKTKLKVFAANPETLMGHNEFLATGGRTYSLRHNDVVQGSDKIVIEVRDRDSHLMKQQIVLKPYEDYEFDYLAGRIVLTQPLSTFVVGRSNQIINTNTTGTDLHYLVVDYEYNDTGSTLDDTSYGVTGQHWFTDHIAVGGTHVSETRSGGKYQLTGIDTTYRMGQNSFVKVEGSSTESLQTNSNFVSDDGGLSFITKPSTVIPGEKANAIAVESQFLLNDFVSSDNDGVLTTWFRNYDAGYSTARRQTQFDTQELGYNLELDYDRNLIKSKYAQVDEKTNRIDKAWFLSYGRRLTPKWTLSGEYRRDDIENLSLSTSGVGDVFGVKLEHRIIPQVDIYTQVQKTLNYEGTYTKNDRWALGTKYRFASSWEGLLEYSDGDRGEGVLGGLGYNLSSSHRIYGNYSNSVDFTTGQKKDGLTLGQSLRFKNGVNLTSENQFETVGDSSGQIQLYGLNYTLNRFLTAGTTVQFGNLEDRNTGELTSKDAASVSFAYNRGLNMSAKLSSSYVKQRGAQDFDRYLVSTGLNFLTGPSYSWAINADYAKTDNPVLTTPESSFFEGNLGLAIRPVNNDRLNLFARYTYLYDLDSQAQANARTDQKVNIISVEGGYDLTRRWQIGARLAQRFGSQRMVRGTGPWIDATLNFAQLRARYHLLKKWDGIAELRAVEVVESKDVQYGTLLGLDYHIGGNIKIGGGFNFTKFNDNLTQFNFNSYGWYINILGKM